MAVKDMAGSGSTRLVALCRGKDEQGRLGLCWIVRDRQGVVRLALISLDGIGRARWSAAGYLLSSASLSAILIGAIAFGGTTTKVGSSD